jgi:mono/diheme cytochrome c family protein
MGGRGGAFAPDLATVQQRRTPAEITRMIDDPQHALPGTIMPRTSMPDEWRTLIVRALGGAATNGAARVEPVTVTSDTSGPLLYARFCAGCHGARGGGDGPNAARLPVRPAVHASRDAMQTRPDDSLFDTIAGGGWIMNRSPYMPAYGSTLSPAQIRSLVRYIRALCGCAGPTWSTDGARGGRF